MVALHCVVIGLLFSIAYSIKPYGTKTSYDRSFSKFDLDDRGDYGELSNCNPIHVTMLYRHGSRFPGKSDIIKAGATMKRLSDKISEDMPEFKTWSVPFPVEKNAELSSTGAYEHKQIATRMATKTLEQLFHNFDADAFHFMASNRSRAIDSAKAFIDGLSEVFQRRVTSHISIRDDLLRFFDKCQKFLRVVDDNHQSSYEAKEFRKTKEMEELVETLNKRLGLSEPDRLQIGEIKPLYSMLAIEEATFGSSIFSKLFTAKDLEIIEYATDLKAYWQKFYGFDINCAQSCPLFSDMVQDLENAMKGHSENMPYRKGTFRFAHAETVLPLVCLLGLFKDKEHLRADNFHQQRKRKFRASVLAPMAANIGFVLYACTNDNQKPHEDEDVNVEYKIQLIFKELVEEFPFCSEKMCSFQDFKDYYSELILNCDYDAICENSKFKKKEEL